ncbi:MAG TPA: Fic/DOC family N-terminal domain-containing protein [Opitutaceae bacterium]|jgi:Fic family protein
MPAKPKPPRKRGLWKADQPFNTLSELPPAGELETKAVLKRCITARAALAELKRAAELIPNQGVLINTLPLLEAQASSAIENIVTTTDRLFQFRETGLQADPATKEALRYSHSLLEGFYDLAAHPLNTRTAKFVCSEIKGTPMSVRNGPGRR